MALPARLQEGYVSIYGANESQNNINVGSNYRFGIVNQTWDGKSTVAAVGQSVLFKIDDSVPLSYGDSGYYVVPQDKIILIESAPA